MAMRSTAEPNSNGDRQSGATRGRLAKLLKDDANALAIWIAVIIGAFAAFWLSEGTAFHQFTVGVLMSSATLLVLVAGFEIIWRAIGGQ